MYVTSHRHSGGLGRSPASLARALAVFLVIAFTQPVATAAAKSNWQAWRTPEEAGFSSASIAEAEQIWNAIDDAPVSAFFLVHKGKVLAAFGDVRADYQCHSVRKSFLSALYGIHVETGAIDVDSTLAELGIDDNNPLTETEKQATVWDLLRARSGIYLQAACETPDMRAVKPERGSHAPGSFWYYNHWDFNALGTIFRDQTGRDIFAEFKAKIAQPIGMQDFKPSRCTYRYEYQFSDHPCYVFRMSARDRARFGQLFLQGGRWGRRQVIPEDWVIESTSVHSTTRHYTGIPGYDYGLMWWVESSKFFKRAFRDRRLQHLEGFSANGFGGQLILVLPDPEMVVVFAVDVPAGGDLNLGETLPILETILTGHDIVDLKLVKVGCREQSAGAGEMLHLTAKVKNVSSIETVATELEFYLAPVDAAGELIRLGGVNLRPLAAKRAKTLKLDIPLPAQIPLGRYRLIATVDGDRNNYDLKGKNNTKLLRRPLEVH